MTIAKSMTPIEEAFHKDMLAVHDNVGRSTGYWPRRFLQKVKRSGGVMSAKYWLAKNGVSEGFKRLSEEKKLEFSTEVLILRAEYKGLFSDEEQAIARKRLEDYGYSQKPLAD